MVHARDGAWDVLVDADEFRTGSTRWNKKSDNEEQYNLLTIIYL